MCACVCVMGEEGERRINFKKVCRCQQKKKNRRGKQKRKCAKKKTNVWKQIDQQDTASLTRVFHDYLPACCRFYYAEHDDCPIPRPLPRLRVRGRDGDVRREPACDRKTIVKALRACVHPPPRYHLRYERTYHENPVVGAYYYCIVVRVVIRKRKETF